MFCPQCGENLIAPNQKFCHICGTEVLATSKATDYKNARIQNETAPKLYYVPVKQQTQLKRGRPGKYSNLSFSLALISVVLGIVPFLFSYNLGFFYIPYDSVFYSFGGRLVLFFVILLLRAVGLTMGVFSRINNSKAVELEPYNDLEKAGSILGIFGIIINVLGLFLSFIGPWSIFRSITEYYY